jgi:transposase-like protein
MVVRRTTKNYQGNFDLGRPSWLCDGMNNQELQADLAKVAAEYNHSVLQQAVLENYKDSILLLRAKYASYEKIAELLTERGIKVSVATVRKFCRKYGYAPRSAPCPKAKILSA